MNLVRPLSWLGAGAAFGAAGVAAYTAHALNGPKRPPLPYTFTPFEVGVPSETVRLTADDGVELSGWWSEIPGSEVVVICCHGHRGNKADMLGIGRGLHRAGHSVLLFDFRGNGDSGDGPQSLAHHEQRDLRAAIEWVTRTRPDARLAVLGFSMGAAITILTAADDPRVEALVLDSPFATMSDVVATAYRKLGLPSAPFLPGADLANRIRYGYTFAQVRPLDAMPRLAPRPVLLVHGTEDDIIPYDHARQLAEAAAPGTVEFVTYEGVGHCGAYFADRPAYIALVADFLTRALPPATDTPPYTHRAPDRWSGAR